MVVRRPYQVVGCCPQHVTRVTGIVSDSLRAVLLEVLPLISVLSSTVSDVELDEIESILVD
jgi:hypothetical protein